MSTTNIRHNTPRQFEFQDNLHSKKPQQQLFTHVEAFFKSGGHKGEEEFIQNDDSINLTEIPFNQNDNSELFREKINRQISPRNPQRSTGVIGNLSFSKRELSECRQSTQRNQSQIRGSDLQKKLASFSYNGFNNNYAMQTLKTDQRFSVQQPINYADYQLEQSPTLSINNDVQRMRRKWENKKENEKKQTLIQIMKVPSISDFTNPTAKKRMTQILKSNITDQIQNKAQNDFEKGNKIILKVLKSSLDRMQRIELHIVGFINKIRNNSQIRKTTHITNEVMTILKDKAYIFKQKQRQHLRFIIFLYQILKKTKHYSFLKVFMPTSSYRLVWDAIQVCFTVLFLYFYSILVFFGQDYNKKSEALSYYFQMALYLFLVDMIVNFNTAFFNKDIIVLDRKLIAKKYIKSEFFTDALCLIMLSLKILFNSHLTYNPDHDPIIYFKNILVFFKIFGIKQKSHMLQSVSALKDSQKHLLRLFNQIILVVLAAHIGKNCFLNINQLYHKNNLLLRG